MASCKAPVNSLGSVLIYAEAKVDLLQPEVCRVSRSSICLESIQSLSTGAKRPSYGSAI